MFQSLADEVLFTQEVVPASRTAASYGTVGTAIDMRGWEGCLFVISLGAIASSGTFDAKVQSAAASAFSTAHDIAGAALVQVADTGGSKIHAIDVKAQTMLAAQSGDRYLRIAVQANGTNAVNASVTAIQYRRNGSLPPAQNFTQLVEV